VHGVEEVQQGCDDVHSNISPKKKLLKDLLFKEEMEMESLGDDFNSGITITINYNYGIN